MLGKIEDKRRRRQQRMRWLDNATDSMYMNWNKLWEIMEGKVAWNFGVANLQSIGITKVTHN